MFEFFRGDLLGSLLCTHRPPLIDRIMFNSKDAAAAIKLMALGN